MRINIILILYVTSIAALSANAGLEDRITADMVLTAYTFGAPTETILMKINTPDNAVEPVTLWDIERLRKAGVPSPVIDALLVRGGQAVEQQPARPPDNPALLDLVRLVQSGMSEQIITEQIRGHNETSRPSIADLLYLKQNNVPEGIISELMAKPDKVASGELTFDGLVIRRFFKDHSGALVLNADKLTWRDASNAEKSFDLFMTGVARINLFYRVRDNGNFCYKVQFEFTKGNHYAFEDVQKDTGGNVNLMHMVNTLKGRFSDIPFVDKEKD